MSLTPLLLLLLAQKTAFIEGTVVGSDGSGTLAKAKITIQYEKAPDGSSALTSANAKGNTTTSGEDGSFRLEAVEGVPFHFGVEREGYVTIGRLFGVGKSLETYTLTGNRTGVVVKLDPESVLGGRLIDADTEKPIADVEVISHRKTEGNYFGFGPRSRTDADGRFRITGMMPGEYKLQIQTQLRPKIFPGLPADSAPAMTYPPLYFPGVPNFADGQTITLRQGAQLEYFDFKIRKERLYTLSGTIQGSDGAAATTSTTKFGQEGISFSGIGDLTGPGPFQIQNVPAGRFSLMFFTKDRDSLKRKQAVVELMVDSDVKDLDLNLQGAFKVRFKVRSLGDHPIDGDPLWTQLKPKITLSFNPQTRANFSSDRPQVVESGEGAEIGGQFGDLMWIHVMGLPKGWALRRGTCNSIEFDRFNFRLDPGRAEHDCELFVSQVNNSVSGEVKTEGALIYALMEPLAGEPVNRRLQRREGKQFRFESLPPSTYHFIATKGLSYVDAALALREGKGLKVEVGENSQLQVNVPYLAKD
ncbi:MAG: hypothetical protein FJW36_04160 [Acidobacteria bacterium]|nr:hypothetical protein [Acidobacteriota bacterium]